eukprot:TRINITY_DN31817_c0_g1_i1.p1 TRINITY_DN31817_c0_g1~~TRINITY_DN31817_c0_g1_i1.p1  ORF type:complete len:272 (-),score=33.83 TRINITY_DN31817_c0_g1_i1:322-1137(-)
MGGHGARSQRSVHSPLLNFFLFSLLVYLGPNLSCSFSLWCGLSNRVPQHRLRPLRATAESTAEAAVASGSFVVGAKTVPHSLARKIVAKLLDTGSCAAHGMGPQVANIAFKSALAAVTILEKVHKEDYQGKQLVMRPTFADEMKKDAPEGEERSVLRYIYQFEDESKVAEYPGSADDEVRVGYKTAPQGLAGAIASRIRQKENAFITAKGATAINTVMKAVYQAERYIEQGKEPDVEGVPGAGLKLVPKMNKITVEGERTQYNAEFYCYKA